MVAKAQTFLNEHVHHRLSSFPCSLFCYYSLLRLYEKTLKLNDVN